MKKKTVSLLLAAVVCVSLCACGSGEAESGRYDTLIGHIEANDYASAYAELNRSVQSPRQSPA